MHAHKELILIVVVALVLVIGLGAAFLIPLFENQDKMEKAKRMGWLE